MRLHISWSRGWLCREPKLLTFGPAHLGPRLVSDIGLSNLVIGQWARPPGLVLADSLSGISRPFAMTFQCSFSSLYI